MLLNMIRESRNFHVQFNQAANNQHAVWTVIAESIFCRKRIFVNNQNKWNVLKKGFENLQLITTGNPERFPISSPIGQFWLGHVIT